MQFSSKYYNLTALIYANVFNKEEKVHAQYFMRSHSSRFMAHKNDGFMMDNFIFIYDIFADVSVRLYVPHSCHFTTEKIEE